MRIDKFLKLSRIIKRRQVAKAFCEKQKVSVNGKFVKPGYSVCVDDVIEVQFGSKVVKFKVKQLLNSPSKEDSKKMFEEVVL